MFYWYSVNKRKMLSKVYIEGTLIISKSRNEYTDVIWENPSHGAKIDILSYWYHVKVWIILFPQLFTWISSDTGIKSYWCSNSINIKKNIRIKLLISFILQFHLLRHVMGFHRSRHIFASKLLYWNELYFMYVFTDIAWIANIGLLTIM